MDINLKTYAPIYLRSTVGDRVDHHVEFINVG